MEVENKNADCLQISSPSASLFSVFVSVFRPVATFLENLLPTRCSNIKFVVIRKSGSEVCFPPDKIQRVEKLNTFVARRAG